MKKTLSKKLLCVALIIMLVASIFVPSASASALLLDDDAAAFTIESQANELLFSIYNGEATLISCDPSVAGDIILPESVSGYPITTIGENAFYACHEITSVTIPKTVSVIDPHAFNGVSKLENIFITDDNPMLKDIDGVVYSIDGTTLIRCPEGKQGTLAIADGTQDVYNYAFVSCNTIDKLIVPESVIYFADDAFYYGGGYPEFYVNENNKRYSSLDGALYNKNQQTLLYFPRSMSGSYTLPETVTKINDYAYSLSRLTEIVIPDTVTEIGNYTFIGCVNLKTIKLPKDIRAITEGMFTFCYAMDNFEIPDTVVEIGKEAFSYCLSLKALTLPNSVVYFGKDIFRYTDSVMIIADESSAAYNYARNNGIRVGSTFDGVIKSVSHTIAKGEIIFTVTTKAGEYNRVKVADSTNPSVCLGTGSSYTVNADGDYVWTFRITAPLTATQFTFDLRSSVTGKYIKEYATYSFAPYNPVSFNKSLWGTVQNGWYFSEDGGFKMNVGSWVENNTSSVVKVVDSIENPTKCISILDLELSLNEFDGIDTDWINEVLYIDDITNFGKTTIGQYNYPAYHFSTRVSTEESEWFLCRTNEKVYLIYFTCTNENDTIHDFAQRAIDSIVFNGEPDKNEPVGQKEEIISVSHEIIDGYVYFKITTTPTNINRIKVATKDNSSVSLGTISSYTIDENGNYVWMLKIKAPTENKEYVFDMRSSITNKYVKSYFYHTVDNAQDTSTAIKSVSHKLINGQLVFTVVTKAGNYNRLRLGYTTNAADTFATTNLYTVNADGDYVWTIKIAASTDSLELVFDLRSSETNKYIKQYYTYQVKGTNTSHYGTISNGWYIAQDGGFMMNVGSWSCYGEYGITLIKDLTGFPTDACVVSIYDAIAFDEFESYTAANFEAYLNEEVTDFEKSTIGAGYRLYHASSDNYEAYMFQANGKRYTIIFIAGDSANKEELVSFAKKAIDSLVVTNQENATIKVITHKITDDKLVFTVRTQSGNYNRLRCGLSASIKDSLETTDSYVVDENGDYVWTITIDAPEESTSLYFDLRDSLTGKFVKEYYILEYNA